MQTPNNTWQTWFLGEPNGAWKRHNTHPDAVWAPIENLGLVQFGRNFVDTMRTWNRPPEEGGWNLPDPDNPSVYDLEDWAWEQYGTMYHEASAMGESPRWPFISGSAAGGPMISPRWGVNRAAGKGGSWMEVGGSHMYQRRFSGTNATVDDIRIHGWVDPLIEGVAGLGWPKAQRAKIGRYYLPVNPTPPPR